MPRTKKQPDQKQQPLLIKGVLYDDRFLESHAGAQILHDPKTAVVELIANAWDAGATEVKVSWPDGKLIRSFSVEDNGTGMTNAEFRRRWRKLNYNRQEEQGPTVVFPAGGTVTHKRRTAFGRNGIGRWSGFCFGDAYVVETHKDSKRNRYRVQRGTTLPTVLVMEEAHNFVKKYHDEAETPEAAAVCCQVFERIAREGRKFGLGLVVSSQRPSELSPTVLSQCNTFLLHRLSNDRDQELVHRFVPDNLRSLLRELPSLSPQNAIFLGWATELPVLVKIDYLPDHHRPRSDDPDFWDVWTGFDSEKNVVNRPADWTAIATEWQQEPGT